MEVFNAFRGEAIELQSSDRESLDSFKGALNRVESIELIHMLLLVSPQGHQLKSEPLDKSGKVFLYDKSWTERPPENKVDLDDEIFAGSSPVAIRNYIAKTRSETAVILEASSIAVKYLQHQLRSINKTVKRLAAFKQELMGDVEACSQWERYWAATSDLPVIGEHLPSLLDREAISSSYAELNTTWTRATQQLDACMRLSETLDKDCDSVNKLYPKAATPDPETDLDDQFRLVTDGKSDAQTQLIDALRKIGRIQLRIVDELRKPLSAVSDDLKKADSLKAKIAEVIDLPFLCGALLIEVTRRHKWISDLEPLRRKEAEREREWHKRYTQGSIGDIVKRLSSLCGIDLDKSVVNDYSGEKQSSQDTAAAEQVADYLAQLQRVGLTDVHDDLKSELGAMQRQFARSMSASITSLMPSAVGQNSALTSPVKESSPVPGSVPSTAAYEARIKKLENALMQTRLGSKKQELDVIRAETRAEARAEARAEVKTEQLNNRIAELEKLNQELSTRLQSYTSNLEIILNSMGLQTSRVDPDTGEFVYRVNRVKGLSRRMSPPSVSSEQASAASQFTSGSTHEPPRQVAVEKLMDQTLIDNQVLYEAVTKRFGDVERLARKLQSENRSLKERYNKAERECRQRVALHSFRPEDLILFLPTRDPRRQPNPWAAFNAGAPHYFLHPRHSEYLKGREYLIARAAEIERRVVTSDSDEENLFGLSQGVEWFLITVHGEWGV